MPQQLEFRPPGKNYKDTVDELVNGLFTLPGNSKPSHAKIAKAAGFQGTGGAARVGADRCRQVQSQSSCRFKQCKTYHKRRTMAKSPTSL
jgi:hypothetical protein